MAIQTYRANNIKAAYASKLSNPNQVCGTQEHCTIQGSSDWWYRTFLQYDLGGIPADAIIQSAKMYVYCKSWNDNGGSGTTNISRVTSDWDESTLCWNKQPTFEGTYLTSNVNAPAVNSWGVWDITSLVNEWHTGTYPNYGLYIKNNNEGAYRVNWDIYNYRYDLNNSNDGDYSNNLGTYLLIEYEYELNSENSGYLIKDDSTIYTVVDGALSALTETELTPELFIAYRVKEFPSTELLLTLTDPEVIYWTDAEEDVLPSIKAIMTATPFTQTIITDLIDMSHHTIKGIESVTVDCDGSPLIAVSFDDKATWIAFDGTQWVTLSSEFSGMTKETVESIPVEQWASVRGDVVAMYIRVVLSTTDQVVRQIYVDFLN